MYLKIITVFTALLLSYAFAHADCETRPTTQAERDFETSALNTIKKAMPAAPAGWKTNTESRLTAADDTCRGANSQVDFNYTVSYSRTELTPAMKELKATNEKRAAERKKLKNEYMKSPEYIKDHERITEIYKLVEAAAKQFSENSRKKDAAGQKKAEANIKALQDEQQALYAKDKAFYEKIAAEEKLDGDAERRDTSAEIIVAVNDYYPDGLTNASAFTPANTQMAFTSSKPSYQGSNVILTSVSFYYGGWKLKDNDEGKKVFEPVDAKGGKGSHARHIYVIVTSNDKDRAMELAKKADLDAIKALITK